MRRGGLKATTNSAGFARRKIIQIRKLSSNTIQMNDERARQSSSMRKEKE